MSGGILSRLVVVRRQPLLPSSMPCRIRRCVNQSNPIKPAVMISKDKVQAVLRSVDATQLSAAPSFPGGLLVASADATSPGVGGSRGSARGTHRTAGLRSAVVVPQRCLAAGTPEHHLDGWNRGSCRCSSAGCTPAVSWLMQRLFCVVVASGAGLLLAWPSAAQTNEALLQERLISPAVFELLQRRGATTPAQRLQVIDEACRSGQLGAGDCPEPLRRY